MIELRRNTESVVMFFFPQVYQPLLMGTTWTAFHGVAPIPLQPFLCGYFGHCIDIAKSHNMMNVSLIGLFAKGLCEKGFFQCYKIQCKGEARVARGILECKLYRNQPGSLWDSQVESCVLPIR